jgi:hypothetical protein
MGYMFSVSVEVMFVNGLLDEDEVIDKGRHRWIAGYLLPDTAADPRDPGWLKVDAIMEEYHVAERKRDEEDAKHLRKIMKGG